MEKKDIVKIFVVAIVALFMIEMAAIGFSISSNNNAGNAGKGESGRGLVDVNATLEAYEPMLFVVGEGSALEAAIARMKEDGEVENDTLNEQGVRVLGLFYGSDVLGIARKLGKANASVSAPAIISIPQQVEVKTPSANFEAAGGALKYPVKPEIEAGGQVRFRAVVNVRDGRIESFESIIVSTSETATAIVQAQFENVAKGKFRVLVPWEKRRIDRGALLAALREEDANATLSYEEKSYALPNVTLSAQQIASIEGGPAYIAGASADAISVARDFTDSQTLQSGLAQIGVGVALPPSVITVSLGEEGNNSQELVYGALNRSGVQALSLEEAKGYRVVLPQNFTFGGVQYSLGEGIKREFEMPLNVTLESGIVKLEVELEHVGGSVNKLISARQGPQ